MNELIGRLQVLWEGLAPRERLLVGLAGGALAVTILLLGIVMPIQAANESATQSAESAARRLQTMQRMKREWDGLNGRLTRVESRIQAARSQPNLLTLLSSLAERVGVKPASMEKRQSGESERYEETKVEVSLKNVTLQQAVGYLASIENADQPLSIKSLRIKRRTGLSSSGSAAELIDVTFSVSGFKPLA